MSAVARGFTALAALLLALATVVGALSAHAFRGQLSSSQFEILQTAVHYQFFHSLGLFGVGLLLDRLPAAPLLRTAAWLLATGIVLFSGSLYGLVAGVRGELGTVIGVLTPIGGLALILAWCLVALGLVLMTGRQSL